MYRRVSGFFSWKFGLENTLLTPYFFVRPRNFGDPGKASKIVGRTNHINIMGRSSSADTELKLDIVSNITAYMKSRITFLPRVPSGYFFFKIDTGGQALSISAQEMAPIRAFSVSQK